ncbi:ATP-binding protein [Paraburkholderia azotifigens]|uniref:AlbA family DNA-binding domain-containing protein n=1 Tax=Paraburkholderia azotifigens TaxID=2057004 RepID=UPI00316C9E41
MYESIEEIEALFGEEAESVTLEYKSGRVFDNLTSDARREFVKDVTAFANAGGGTIIIGVAENRDGARNTASGFEPVTNAKITVDQLTSIVRSNSDPVFNAFRIRCLDHSNGRIFVIEIDQADTAHQNRLDQKYYQRTGTVSEGMYDFAIRDVMNRRTKPRVSVRLAFEWLQRQPDLHSYRVSPVIENEGHLSARHWSLYVALPEKVCSYNGHYGSHVLREQRRIRHANVEYRQWEYQSGIAPANPNGVPLLPGQRLQCGLADGYGELLLNVTHNGYGDLIRLGGPPLRWTMFVDDCPRQDGAVPFDEWCKF